MKRILQYILLFYLVGTLTSTFSSKLRITLLRVPTLVDIRDANATLACHFELGDHETLYSVKWYKDDLEFFRYMPGSIREEMPFPVAGVKLQGYSSSDENVRLVLKQLTFKSSGTYACEVSSEAPTYKTMLKRQNMTVMALPRSEPTINGLQPSYSIGERVSAVCTADKSYPAPAITWYINGIKAQRWLIYGDVAHDQVDREGMITRSMPLHFTAERRFFERPGGVMELRCTAAVGDKVWQKLATPGLGTFTNQQLAQEQRVTSDQPTMYCKTPSVFTLSLLATIIRTLFS